MNEKDEVKSELRIKIIEHGSYRVSGGPRLTIKIPLSNPEGERVSWADGKDYPEKNKYALGRCGHSKNKPYCDASHKEQTFDGVLTADREPGSSRWNVFKGSEMIMTDDESLCAGFGYCDRFGSVWSEIEHSEDPVVKGRMEDQISKCPSGRLQYFLNNPEPVEIKYEPAIAAIPNGPLWVLGEIPIETEDGFQYESRNRVLLCRCGHSGNKPFCDGSHSSVGFKSE